MNEKIKQALEETLAAEERVLWESETQPFKLLEGKEGRRTLLQWVISTVCCVGFAAFRLAQGELTPATGGILLAIYALLMLSPIVSYRQLLGQRYFLTGDRAILIRRDGMVYSMKLAGDTAAKLFPVKPGAAIAIGQTVVEEGDKQLRWRSIHALENPGQFDGCNASGLVFYNVARAESAIKLLSEKAGAAQETK